MFGPNWKYLMVGAVVVAATLAVTASQAEAQCWTSCRPVAWTSCTTCYTSPCTTTCCPRLGYRLWNPGPVRRLLFGPCGLRGSCARPWGFGWQASYPTTTAYTVSYPPMTTVPEGAAPADSVLETEPAPAPAEPTVAPPSDSNPPLPPMPEPTTRVDPTRADSGLLTIYVPYGAKVTVNGYETKSIGSRREYVSFGLVPGYVYKYEVRAEIEREGELISETQTIVLRAGAIEGVAFGFQTPALEQVAIMD